MGPDLLFLQFPSSFFSMPHSKKQGSVTLSASSLFSVFGYLIIYKLLLQYTDNIRKACIEKKVVRQRKLVPLFFFHIKYSSSSFKASSLFQDQKIKLHK